MSYLFALALAQMIQVSVAQTKSELASSPTPCVSPGASVQIDDETYRSRVTERKRVGTITGAGETIEVWSVRRVLSPEADANPNSKDTKRSEKPSDNRKSIACSNLELEERQGTKIINLADVSPSDVTESPTPKSIRVQRDQIVVTKNNISRFSDERATFVTVYRYDPSSPSHLKIVSRYETSPAKEAENRAFAALKRSTSPQDLRKVIHLIGRLAKDPSGWGSVSRAQFDRFAPLFIEKLKVLHAIHDHARDRSSKQLALEFVAALLRDEADQSDQLDPSPEKLNESSWYHDREPSARDIQLWNDLAFNMILEGQHEAGAEFLRWVIDWAPGRSIAHLNLAEALWPNKDARDEALQHLFVYQKQKLAFLGEKAILKPEFARALKARLKARESKIEDEMAPEDPDAFAVDQLHEWLGFEERPECLDFWGPRLVPATVNDVTEKDRPSNRIGDSQKQRSSVTRPKTFDVKSPVCVQGVPIDPKQPVTFLNGNLYSGRLARAHKFQAARCREDSEFRIGPNQLQCELDGNQEVLGLPLLGGSTVDIGPEYQLKSFTLSKNAPFGGYVLKAQRPMELTGVVSIAIAEPLHLDGTEFPANTEFKILGAQSLPAPSELKRYQVWIDLPAPTRFRGLLLQGHVKLKPGLTFDGKGR
jgi:hypothetical protein